MPMMTMHFIIVQKKGMISWTNQIPKADEKCVQFEQRNSPKSSIKNLTTCGYFTKPFNRMIDIFIEMSCIFVKPETLIFRE